MRRCGGECRSSVAPPCRAQCISGVRQAVIARVAEQAVLRRPSCTARQHQHPSVAPCGARCHPACQSLPGCRRHRHAPPGQPPSRNEAWAGHAAGRSPGMGSQGGKGRKARPVNRMPRDRRDTEQAELPRVKALEWAAMRASGDPRAPQQGKTAFKLSGHRQKAASHLRATGVVHIKHA